MINNMFSTFNLADHVLAVTFEEKVDSDSFYKLKELIEARLQSLGNINLFLEIQGGKGFTLSALLKDLAFEYENSAVLDRVAIVSDKQSLQKLMILKNLFLRTEVQTFDSEDRIQAMNWVMNKSNKNYL